MADTLIDIAKGNVAGDRLVRVAGRRSNIGSTEDDVWTGGEAASSPVAQKTFPSSAATLAVVSTSTNDASGGTGAQSVLITGLNTDWGEIRETVALNGLTTVNTVQSFVRVNGASVVTAGSTGSNAGEIKISHSSALQAHMLAGSGVAQMTHYSVPARVRALIVRSFVDASVEDVTVKLFLSASADPRVSPSLSARVTARDHKLGFSPLTEANEGALVAEEMTDVWFRASVGTGTAYVAAGLELILTPYKSLISYTSGSFSRGTEASYLVRGDALVWDSSSATKPRFEDRGDGFGPQALFEGQRQNLLLQSEAHDNASWTHVSDSITGANIDSTVAPDGDKDADSHPFGAAGTARASQSPTVADNSRVTLSVWGFQGAATPPTQIFRLAIVKKDTTVTFGSDNTLIYRWARFSLPNVDILAHATNQPEGRLQNSSDAVSRTVVLWGAQFEIGKFESSYIRTTTVAVTRNADVLTISAGPTAEMRSGKWRFDFWPYWGTSVLTSGDTFVLFSFGGTAGAATNQIRVTHTGGNVRLEVVVGGVTVGQSGVLSFGPHSRVRVALDAASASVVVNGTTQPAIIPQPWILPAGEIRVGGVDGGASEAFARISEPVAG